MKAAPSYSRDAIPSIAARLERQSASDIIGWAVGEFGSELVVACSFQDCVLLDLAVSVDARIEVLFLDTGYHFQETLDFVETVRRHYSLNLTTVHPGSRAAAFPCGSEQCCQWRKVEPLERALLDRSAWVTGLKRSDAPTRATTPVVGWDESRGMVKVNPLALWSDGQIAEYVQSHSLPEHPLTRQGYLSIGCAPTTRPVKDGEDPRAGRWADSDKTECGLHS
ncbi:MAG: phosphoadenylyl-sulfate reductase [Candidatus Dormibacteria bacterium]